MIFRAAAASAAMVSMAVMVSLAASAPATAFGYNIQKNQVADRTFQDNCTKQGGKVAISAAGKAVCNPPAAKWSRNNAAAASHLHGSTALQTTNPAGADKVTGLKKTTEVVKHREGGDPSSSATTTVQTGGH